MPLFWVRVVLASAAATAPVALATAVDPPVPQSQGLATRKQPERPAGDTASSDADPAAMETLATLFNTHTGEATALSSSEPTEARFSELLADRVTGSSVRMDPRLLGLLKAIAKKNPGVRIEIVSGYRSPKLNEMLRKKGHRVASHSQHSLGHAVDFRVIGLTPARTAEQIADLRWPGGVGEYEKPTDTFVHADVGRERQWRGER
jgi:uncharacterized protein YcbK (DUF882 family)